MGYFDKVWRNWEIIQGGGGASASPSFLDWSKLPNDTSTRSFKELAAMLYAKAAYPELTTMIVSQWALESNWGNSALAKTYNNYAGIKYRPELESFAVPVNYGAHDGYADYAAFPGLDKFINGYFTFLDRKPYQGWRMFQKSPESWIRMIGPIWAEDPKYVEKVMSINAKLKSAQRDAT